MDNLTITEWTFEEKSSEKIVLTVIENSMLIIPFKINDLIKDISDLDSMINELKDKYEKYDIKEFYDSIVILDTVSENLKGFVVDTTLEEQYTKFKKK